MPRRCVHARHSKTTAEDSRAVVQCRSINGEVILLSVSLSIELSTPLRPSLVLDYLERELLGCRELLAQHLPWTMVVKSGLRIVVYELPTKCNRGIGVQLF